MAERRTANKLNSNQARAYRFISVPHDVLIGKRFKLSLGARVLYAAMFNRATLSEKNAKENNTFVDAEDNVYIYYANAAICEDLDCSKNSATKFVNELLNAGLIESKVQGLGKPVRYYVMDFATLGETDECYAREDFEESEYSKEPSDEEEIVQSEPVSAQNPDDNSRSQNLGVLTPTAQNTVFPFPKTGSLDSHKTGSLASQNLGTNKIEINNTEFNNSSLPPTPSDIPMEEWTEENILALEDEVKQQISFDILLQKGYSEEQLTEVVRQITSALCCTSSTIKLGGQSCPIGLVKTRMRQLDCESVEFALDELAKAKNVKNPRAYLFTVLFNAPISVTTATQVKYNSDFDAPESSKPSYNIDEVERMSFFAMPPGM